MRKLLLRLLLLFTSLTCFGVTPEEFKEFRQTAEQGDAEAQYILGFMYNIGGGVPEDDTEAVKWFRKSAEQGNAKAQYNLGMMYYYGTGVPEDYVESYMWLNLSAARGTKEAMQNKEVISEKMTKEQIAEAQKLSREWLAKRQE